MVSKWLIPKVIVSSLVMASCASNAPKPEKIAPEMLRMHQIDYSNTDAFLESAPNRYIVKKGDNLWIIANKFLSNPARWREVWHSNPHISNPNLIYPGDVISFTGEGKMKKIQVAGSTSSMRKEFKTKSYTADGRPIYNLEPSVREEPLDQPIPTVPYEAINPFLTKNRIMEEGFSKNFPYIVGDAGSYLSLSHKDKVYAKGSFQDKQYDVFREADKIIDPVSDHLLGVEARYVGKVQLIKPENEDGIATFAMLTLNEPLYPNDVLIPPVVAEQGGRLSFLPSIPKVSESPLVIRPMENGLSGSQFQTILINQGKNNGIVEGNVFKIVRGKNAYGKGRDGEAFKLPDYEVGMGIVYKVYNNISYLLVMDSEDAIYSKDRLVMP